MLRSTQLSRVLSAALLIASSATAMAQEEEDDPPPSPNLPPGFTAPALAGRYMRVSVHDFGSPWGGVAYQYRSPISSLDSTFATLYLYQRISVERGLPISIVLAMEVDDLKRDLAKIKDRGDYDEYHITSEQPDTITMSAGWKIPGRRVAYIYHRKGLAAASFLYIYAVGEKALVKIRATTPASKEKTTDIPEFVQDLVQQAAAKAPHG